MSHFARIDDDNVVVEIIVAEQSAIDSGMFGDTSKWIRTSYNTHGGEHILGGEPLRKNYATVGMVYDRMLDAFIQPQPYPSWILDETTGYYKPPVEYPIDGMMYVWDEELLQWNEILPTLDPTSETTEESQPLNEIPQA